jgi:hypothetical protein
LADSRTLHKLLCHGKASTTMTYAQVLEISGGALRSPLDFLAP